MTLLFSFLLLASAGELRFCIMAEPKTLHPLQVSEQSAEVVRYLTSGVLARVNRLTQQPEPELASSWKVTEGGRKITFKLRPGLRYSDGTPFTVEDVVNTVRTLMEPGFRSALADTLRGGHGPVTAIAAGPGEVSVVFPVARPSPERLFDQVSIVSSRSQLKERAALGPFMIAEHKPGAYLRLARNPHYWKKDGSGRTLPYADAVTIDIQQNRDLEAQRFRRGQLDLMNGLDPALYEQIEDDKTAGVRDSGPSLNVQFLWFNLSPGSPVAAYKKAWFASREFRWALSQAVNRADLCRVVFRNHAQPASGPVSPADRYWYNQNLRPHPYDPAAALKRLEKAGFRLQNGVLRDRAGNGVEFSVITNAGNRARGRMAAMVQQDWAKIGIKLNIVTLDFASLVERIGRTSDYETCLLGFANMDIDPTGQMNVFLSSAPQHMWNPSQKAPATAWEAEMDRLMRAQAVELNPKKRKASYDRVQQIMCEEAPVLYLVVPSELNAIAPGIGNAAPAVLFPQTFWNAELLVPRGGRR